MLKSLVLIEIQDIIITYSIGSAHYSHLSTLGWSIDLSIYMLWLGSKLPGHPKKLQCVTLGPFQSVTAH